MPKRNTSGPSRGRRASAPDPDQRGKSFSKKSEGNPFERSKRPTSERPFKRGSSAGPGSFNKSSDRPSNSKFKRTPSDNSPDNRNPNKSFDKRERGPKTSFNKKEESRPQREGRKNFSADSRRDSPAGNFGKGVRPHQNKRTSSFSGGSKEERPFRKFDKPGSKEERPGFKKRDSYSSEPDRQDRSFKKGTNAKPLFKRRDDSSDLSSSSGKHPGSEARKTSGFTPRGLAEHTKRPRKGATTGPGAKSFSPKEVPSTGNERTPEPGKIRLNKFIANSGVCSRREADELIKMGLISVNGKTISELGYKVNPSDEVRHESKVLRAEKPVYILLNKPKGFLTTTVDPQERKTVMQLIGNVIKERVYPVGRLDRNTTGLLLLTNDGELAERLMHPSYKVKKIYKVELDRPLTKADAQRIIDGVKLEEGRAMVDDLAIVSDDRKTVGLEIHIGWNRVVRRIFETLEYSVVKLDRTVYAGLNKKDLGRGEWRFLKNEEMVLLKHF